MINLKSRLPITKSIMIRQKSTLISIADEKKIVFLSIGKDGGLERQSSLPMDALQREDAPADAVPKWVRQKTHSLFVIPDYWIANTSFEFKSRKRSIITAFIERKLKLDQPNLKDAGDFYDYAIVQDRDHRPMLFCTYLQEPSVYDLYRRFESFGMAPHRITSPALIWQAWLNRHVGDIAQRGIGFVHLMENDCFLYFYNLNQFLFSRHIQLPVNEDDPAEIYNLLTYEINQSFYLYSQKSKKSVETLFLLAHDPEACGKLSEILGRDLEEVPAPSGGSILPDDIDTFAVCRGFSTLDLKCHEHPSISYKPLRQELTWRPVQWAGAVIGIVLVLLLVAEAGYLALIGKDVLWQQAATKNAAPVQNPQQVLRELTQDLNDITAKLGQPSAGDVMARTLLAMPGAVLLDKINMDTSAVPRLTIDALVEADDPKAFKTILATFIRRLNQRFNLDKCPLREKDIRIKPVDDNKRKEQSLYRINFSFELS